jgi:hypothetical protein
MATTLTVRMRDSLQGVTAGGRAYAAGPLWMPYLAVGGLVTTYLWTPAALRDTVGTLERGFHVFGWFSLLAVLGCTYAVRACEAGCGVMDSARSGVNRYLKAVRT